MLPCLTSAQVADWIAYAQLEPVGNPIEMESDKQKATKIKKNLRGIFDGLKEKRNG